MRTPFVLTIAIILCSASSTNAQQTFPLYCRGPLNFVVETGGHSAVVSFSRGTQASGTDGAAVAKGTCALEDRPMSSDEPAKLFLPGLSAGSLHLTVPAFLACNADQRCVFIVRVYNNKTGASITKRENRAVSVYFPQFQ
jgi:hypothetical protein